MALEMTTKHDQAQWRYLYNLMDGKTPGSIVTYDDMAAAFPEPFDKDRHRPVITKAGDHLLREQRRAIRAVPNVGYRIITADEHLGAAHDRRLRSKRQAGKSRKLLKFARRDEMTPEVAAKVDALQQRMSDLESRLTRSERRQEELDRTIKAVTRKQSDEQQETAQRVLRLEQALRDRGLLSA